MNKRISITAKCAMALWLAPVAAAQPLRTTIQDVLYKADGTRLTGLAVIGWNSFQAADGTNITQSSVSVTITNGNFQVQLIPTTNALQAIWYTVDYNSDGKFQFQERWAVPPSAAALRIQDVRSAAGGLLPPPTTSIRESDVVGLTADLSLRPIKGPGFSPNRSARIQFRRGHRGRRRQRRGLRAGRRNVGTLWRQFRSSAGVRGCGIARWYRRWIQYDFYVGQLAQSGVQPGPISQRPVAKDWYGLFCRGADNSACGGIRSAAGRCFGRVLSRRRCWRRDGGGLR